MRVALAAGGSAAALALLARHPLVQAALGPCSTSGEATPVLAATAFSTVQVLQPQLAAADGPEEQAARRAACQPLLHLVAQTLQQAMQQAYGARSNGAAGAKPAKKEKRRHSSTGSGEQQAPAAPLHWAALLPWADDTVVAAAAGELVGSAAAAAGPGSWQAAAAVSTIRELLSRRSLAPEPQLLRSCCELLERLVAHGPG